MTGELAVFVAARLAEDEAVAKDAAPSPWRWVDPGGRYRSAMVSGSWYAQHGWHIVAAVGGSGPDAGDAAHIARHDPARVLREVAATRAVLAAYEASVRSLGPGLSVSLWRLVQAAAEVWSDHPDYRQEWKSA